MTTTNPIATSSTIMKAERNYMEERHPELKFREAPQFRSSFFSRKQAETTAPLDPEVLKAHLDDVVKQVADP